MLTVAALWLWIGPARSFAAGEALDGFSPTIQWGGHIKIRGGIGYPKENSVFDAAQNSRIEDGSMNFRLNADAGLADRLTAAVHYEVVAAGGDSREIRQQLLAGSGKNESESPLLASPPDDRRRLMDLTDTLSETDRTIVYHRLDRLVLNYLPTWGTVRMGRQALTWGNGMLFHPMDLFNPFAPTAVDRDYKLGDDMFLVQRQLGRFGDIQALCVPRRNPISGSVLWEESSLAGKWHGSVTTSEFDVMAASHYDEAVVGLGGSGYWRDAAWRMDAVWTFLDNHEEKAGFLALAANLDTSWIWSGMNFYGFVELYFNGLGSDNPAAALTDPALVERLARGELFTVGRTYLAGRIQAELHPLLNGFATVIHNTGDASGVFQPYLVWDVRENWQLTMGAEFPYGPEGSEFGGFTPAGWEQEIAPPLFVFAWLTRYF